MLFVCYVQLSLVHWSRQFDSSATQPPRRLRQSSKNSPRLIIRQFKALHLVIEIRYLNHPVLYDLFNYLHSFLLTNDNNLTITVYFFLILVLGLMHVLIFLCSCYLNMESPTCCSGPGKYLSMLRTFDFSYTLLGKL